MTIFTLHYQGKFPIAVSYGMAICMVASIAKGVSVLEIFQDQDLRLHIHLLMARLFADGRRLIESPSSSGSDELIGSAHRAI